MTLSEVRPTVFLGDPAPDFALPAVDGSGTVSLADYRGRTPLFLVRRAVVPFLPAGHRPDRNDAVRLRAPAQRGGVHGLIPEPHQSSSRTATVREQPAMSSEVT